MKIVVYIPSYDLSNYFYKVINNFLSYQKHDVDIKLYIAKKEDEYFSITWPTSPKSQKNIDTYEFDSSIKQGLAFKYRDQLIEDQDKYDVFIYCEDDILIKESVIDTFIEENKSLPDDTVIGVLRYETFLGGKYLTEFDVTTAHTHSLVPAVREINNRSYFSSENVHQGCWLLERRNLNQILINNQFVFKWGELSKFGEVSEDAASNVYRGKWPGTSNGLNKVVPINKMEFLLVNHLSNKYVNKLDEIWSLERLKNELGR